MNERNLGPAPNVYGSGGNVPYVTPVTEERAAYNEVLSMYANAKDPIAILPSQLRSEVVLAGTATSFAFNFRADQPNPGMQSIRPTENRLDINDAFVVRELSVQFGIEIAATALPELLKLHTFANADATLGFGAAAPAIVGAYNGRVKLMVNTVEFMTGLDMYGFRYVDTAQANTTTGADAYRKGMAFRSMVPQIRIKGSDKAQIIVDLPGPLNFGALAGSRVVAVLMANGLRIGNGGGSRSVQ